MTYNRPMPARPIVLLSLLALPLGGCGDPLLKTCDAFEEVKNENLDPAQWGTESAKRAGRSSKMDAFANLPPDEKLKIIDALPQADQARCATMRGWIVPPAPAEKEPADSPAP